METGTDSSQKLKKDGTPDRRYKINRKYPSKDVNSPPKDTELSRGQERRGEIDGHPPEKRLKGENLEGKKTSTNTDRVVEEDTTVIDQILNKGGIVEENTDINGNPWSNHSNISESIRENYPTKDLQFDINNNGNEYNQPEEQLRVESYDERRWKSIETEEILGIAEPSNANLDQNQFTQHLKRLEEKVQQMTTSMTNLTDANFFLKNNQEIQEKQLINILEKLHQISETYMEKMSYESVKHTENLSRFLKEVTDKYNNELDARVQTIIAKQTKIHNTSDETTTFNIANEARKIYNRYVEDMKEQSALHEYTAKKLKEEILMHYSEIANIMPPNNINSISKIENQCRMEIEEIQDQLKSLCENTRQELVQVTKKIEGNNQRIEDIINNKTYSEETSWNTTLSKDVTRSLEQLKAVKQKQEEDFAILSKKLEATHLENRTIIDKVERPTNSNNLNKKMDYHIEKRKDEKIYEKPRGRPLIVAYNNKILTPTFMEILESEGNLDQIVTNGSWRPMKDFEKGYELQFIWRDTILLPTKEELRQVKGNMNELLKFCKSQRPKDRFRTLYTRKSKDSSPKEL